MISSTSESLRTTTEDKDDGIKILGIPIIVYWIVAAIIMIILVMAIALIGISIQKMLEEEKKEEEEAKKKRKEMKDKGTSNKSSPGKRFIRDTKTIRDLKPSVVKSSGSELLNSASKKVKSAGNVAPPPKEEVSKQSVKQVKSTVSKKQDASAVSAGKSSTNNGALVKANSSGTAASQESLK